MNGKHIGWAFYVNRPFNCGLLSTLFLEPFGKVVALGPTEQVWVAQTGRARLVDR